MRVSKHNARNLVLAIPFVATLGFAADAHAEIPYADQLTPGTLRGISADPGDEWVLGYWEYLPANFDDLGDGELLPLLVFLPGIGEYDDDSTCPGNADLCGAGGCNGDGLCRALTWGPQSLMTVGQWDDTTRPFIMVSPQNPVPPFSQLEWDLDELDTFFQFLVDNYPVDPRRMYITGMSQGGRGTMQYVAANPRRFTAAAPTPGGQVQFAASCSFQDTAFWVFHGEDDQDGHLGPGIFNPCAQVEMLYIYNNPDQYPAVPDCVAAVGQPRPVGRMTMYYDVAHSSWIQTIDPIGSGFPAAEWASDQGCGYDDVEFREYSAANDADGIYSWFLGLDRPDVVAPDDADVVPTDAELTATVTDDDAITWTWTQTAGPDATMANADSASLDLSDLVPLTDYTFEVFVVDADGQWDRDEVTIHVTEAPPVGSSSDGGTSGVSETVSASATTAADASGGVTTDASDATADASASDATADATAGDASAGDASASASGSVTAASAGDSSGGSTGGSDSGGENSDNGGCGCTSGAEPTTPLFAGIVLSTLVARRRRRVRG